MRWWTRPEVDCPQCGATAPADARWCGTCGAALRPETPSPAEDDELGVQRSEPRSGRVAAAGVLVLVLVGLLVGQATTEPPVVPAGFTSRGDGARSGVVSTTSVPAPSGVAWRSPVDLPPLLSPGTDVLGTTTAADGRELLVVLDPSPDGQRVTAHDATDGALLTTTMLPLGSQPYDLALRDGLLAYRDLTSVTLVDLTTGQRRWRVETRLREDSTLTSGGVVGVPATADGIELVLLAADDGSEQWRQRLGDAGRVTRVTASGDRVVVTGSTAPGEPFVAGIDAADGTVVWRLAGDDLPEQAAFPLAPVTVGAGRVVVAGVDRVLVVDLADGRTTATITDDDSVGGPAIVTAVGPDLLVRSDGLTNIVGYDLVTGQRRWASPATSAPVLALEIRDDVVAVRGDSATVLLDGDSGAVVGRVGPAGGTSRLITTDGGGVAQVTVDGAVEVVGGEGVRWRVPTIAVHVPDLSTDAGAVAATTPDGVQVHDVRSGERRWSHAAFEPQLVTAGSLTPPALLAGRVFIAPALTQPADRGGLLSLFADTGIVGWARTEDRVAPRGTPVVDRDLVVLPVGSQLLGFDRVTGRRALVVETTIARTDLAAADGWLVATDAPRDGGDLWVGRRATRDLVFRAPIRTCAPPVVHDDLAIVVNHLGDIVARRLEDGEQPWGERAGGSACRPLSIAGEVLVALVDDRELLAVTLDDGETAWRLELPAHAAGAPVVAGDKVLVPTLAGEVVAYTVDGTTPPDGPAWRVAVDGTPAGAVAVDGETVLVLTREGELVALR